MSDATNTVTLEQLSQLNVEKAAAALMQMPPKEAFLLLTEMPEDRMLQVRRHIFDKNFSFYADMMAEDAVMTLNATVLREHEDPWGDLRSATKQEKFPPAALEGCDAFPKTKP